MPDPLIACGNTGAISLEMTETDKAHHIVGIEDEQTNANDIIMIENQQPSPVQLDPHDHNVHVEDLIASLDRKISQTEDAYSKIKDSLCKLPTFYAIMQVGILSAVFSAPHSRSMDCKDLRGPLSLSVIASAGVIGTLLGKYFTQFHLLRRGRRLIQERISVVGHSSVISVVDLKEELDYLDINSNYWRWTAERAGALLMLISFSICFWHSCKSALLCM